MGTVVKKLRGMATGSGVRDWNVNAPAPASKFLNRLEEGIKKVGIESVKTAEPFISLLPIRDEVLAAITDNMRIKGYDQSQPLIIWKERGVLVDGHTRLTAAKAVGIETVPVVNASFSGEGEAISYMLQIQFSRRNIKDGELVRLAKKMLRGYNKAADGSKADYLTNKFIGLSATKAKKIYFIAENAGDVELKELDEDNITINKLFNSIKDSSKQESAAELKKTNEALTAVDEAPKKVKSEQEQEVKKVHVDFLNLSYTYPYIYINKGGKEEKLLLGFYDTELADSLYKQFIGLLEKYLHKNKKTVDNGAG
jgi:ParB family chromosome partitioning protein